jgi:spore coat protein H
MRNGRFAPSFAVLFALVGCGAKEPPRRVPAATGGSSPQGTGGESGSGTGGMAGPGDSDAGSTGPDGAAPAADAGGFLPTVPDQFGTLPSGGGVAEAALAFEDRLYKYELAADPADLAKMNANPAMYDDQGIFIPAMLTIDGTPFGKVGLRYKGSWGTFRTCLPNPDGSGPAEPYHPIAGNGCPPVPKFPYKVSFDEYVPTQRFHGLKKVNLHNLIRDTSKIHEKLAYQLFRDMGIATARSTHAVVVVNGVSKGVYAVTEHLGDGRYTEDHWPTDSNGNMYKQAWPIWLFADYWVKALETNNMAVPPATHEKAIAFSTELRAATDKPAAALAALTKWSDVDWLFRYMAVDTAIRNADGITKLGCVPGDLNDCSGNNFYWYVTKTGKFLLLPWDLDYTWNVVVDHDRLPPWDLAIPAPGIASCKVRFALYGSPTKAASCDPFFQGLNSMRPLYIAAVKKLLASPGFQVAKLQADVDRISAYLKDAVAMDPAIPATWPMEAATLKANIQMLRDKMQAVADGQPYRTYTPMPAWIFPTMAP